MPINFHDEQNRLTYTGRNADVSWTNTIRSILNPTGLRVADVGCGGGIYTQAWVALGAAEVVGVDGSATMVSAAKENCQSLANVSFAVGDAAATGLPDNSVDVVFERALIHHLQDLGPCLREAMRVLKSGGRLIIQDRTPDDISLPGSPEHIRGYFFECFPRLLDVELGRRRNAAEVVRALNETGYERVETITLWETRKVYPAKEEVGEEIRQRKGRSILHDLDDSELEVLVSFVNDRLPEGEVVEKDQWTIWTAVKP